MTNLIREFAGRGLRIDLLRIRHHGPHLTTLPDGVQLVDLGTAHVNSSLPSLIAYLRRVRPRVLLADKDRLNRLALWARRIARVPTRVAVRIGTTVTDNLARRSWLDRNLQYFSFRHFYPWADVILVPSRGAASDLARTARLSEERITVVPSPVLGPEIHVRAAEAPDHPWFEPGQPPVVIGVGELCARKDFETLLHGFARLDGQHDLRLIILGEGRRRAALEALVEQLGLRGKVDLPGFVANPYAWMARAALFVLTSRCEGAPVVLMEALGLGVPVVSTDCPSGPREILQEGRYGRLVPVGDAAALGAAMLETLDRPLVAEDLQAAVAAYSVRNGADAYLQALGLEP